MRLTFLTLLLPVITFLLSAPSFAKHVCYISLNDTQEEGALANWVKQKNLSSALNVEEFQTTKTDPEQTLTKMIQSKTVCDELVISGHHSGSFWGANAEKYLALEFLEEASCTNPGWFSKIKVVYLQGCRTLGFQQVRTSDLEGMRVQQALHNGNDQGDVDYHELVQGFDNIYDEFNPLSIRHAAIFPNAIIFGYADTAPSTGNSERTIPYHILNYWRLLRAQVNPNATMEDAIKSLFQQNDPKALERAGDAWADAGQRGLSKGFKSISNYDNFSSVVGLHLRAQQGDSESLLKQRCAFTGDTWSPQREQALRTILTSTDSINFNFSTLNWYLSQSSSRAYMLPILNQSTPFKSYIETRLAAPSASLLGRLKLLDVYSMLDGTDPGRFFNGVFDEAINIIIETKPHGMDDDAYRDIRYALIQNFPASPKITALMTNNQADRTWSYIEKQLDDFYGEGDAKRLITRLVISDRFMKKLLDLLSKPETRPYHDHDKPRKVFEDYEINEDLAPQTRADQIPLLLSYRNSRASEFVFELLGSMQDTVNETTDALIRQNTPSSKALALKLLESRFRVSPKYFNFLISMAEQQKPNAEGSNHAMDAIYPLFLTEPPFSSMKNLITATIERDIHREDISCSLIYDLPVFKGDALPLLLSYKQRKICPYEVDGALKNLNNQGFH